MPTIFDDLVEEMVHEIAGWLTRARDRKNFGLSVRLGDARLSILTQMKAESWAVVYTCTVAVLRSGVP
jgi:hypothetical protein